MPHFRHRPRRHARPLILAAAKSTGGARSLQPRSGEVTNRANTDFADSVSISEAEVQQFALGKPETGLSKKTVHDIIAVLKSIGRFGAKRGMFEMPSWEIEYPSDSAVRTLPVLSLPDHKKLLKAITSAPTLQNIGIMIALCCGLRISEVCTLKWKDVGKQ